MDETNKIITTVLKYYPDVQAVYLFGSYGTDQAWADSDIDIAVLLPHEKSCKAGCLLMSDLRFELERLLGKGVDLINLRRVGTVLQKEIVMADRRIYYGDEYAADEFEMLTFSYYQKLNEERREILEDILANGRIYKV
ncbi:MAG TPA: nucleotidyltransferase domain-containing protein [Sedimentisphaerales bacterium]|nr:nucleotidyltransferase domain-containing protein [Sedimentisphaerales bacterium]